MKHGVKTLSLLLVLLCTVATSFADRGVGKRMRTRLNLNIPANSSLKSSLSFNLKAGLKYTGSMLTPSGGDARTSGSTLVTYQKGSSIYIIPYKPRVVLPESRPGYSGLKVILKKN